MELPHESLEAFRQGLQRIQALALQRQETLASLPTIATQARLETGVQSLPTTVPREGEEVGLSGALDILLDTVLPTLAQGQAGPRYFGFVTGGTLPSALLTDMVVSMMDANVQVHLPRETLSTVIEQHALRMVMELLGLTVHAWSGTFTTGATTSNLLALASARQAVLAHAMRRRQEKSTEEEHGATWDPAEDGLGGMDVPLCKVFVCQAHASIQKSAAILGVGRKNVVDVGRRSRCASPRHGDVEDIAAAAETLEFDVHRLDAELAACHEAKHGAIVVVGMGEVMTGALSDQTPVLRSLCTHYGAWLHMDAAFSSFVCLHSNFTWLSSHMDMCDSLTTDAHKTLNVPYDCGIVYVKKHTGRREENDETHSTPSAADHMCMLDDVCSPYKRDAAGEPSYLAPSSSTHTLHSQASETQVLAATLPSPLNRNLENSRRFRALPVYISLLSQGRRGTRHMIERHLAFAAHIRAWLRKCPYYQVLTPDSCHSGEQDNASKQRHEAPKWTHPYWPTTIVIFRAHPHHCPIPAYRASHLHLMEAIKQTQKVYVSPAVYAGMGAVRIAISNWATGIDERDFASTTQVLTQVMERQA